MQKTLKWLGLFLSFFLLVSIGKAQKWPTWTAYDSFLRRVQLFVPTEGLKLLVDPGRQMIEGSSASLEEPPGDLILGENLIENGDFSDFTLDVAKYAPVAYWNFDTKYNADNGGSGYIGEDWVHGNPFGPNVIINGDFSLDSNGDGLADNWGTHVDSHQIINGAQRLFYDPTAQSYYHYSLSQGGVLQENKQYRLTFKLRGTKNVYVRQGIGGTRYFFATIYTSTDWQTHTLFITGQSNATYGDYLNFESALLFDPDDWLEFADVVLEEIVNPHTLLPTTGFDYQNQMTGSSPIYKGGNAVEFDGVSDFFYIPADQAQDFNPGTGDASIAITFFNINQTASQTLFSKGAGAVNDPNYPGYWARTYNSGCLHVQVNSDTEGGGYIDVFVLQNNEWYSVVLSFDYDTEWKVYLYRHSTGELSTYTHPTAFTGSVSSSSTYFTIGAWNAGSFFFGSFISEAAYFNRALSEQEVKEIYGLAKGWDWDGNGSVSNNNFQQVVSGGGTVTQDLTTTDNTLYKEQIIGTNIDITNYFGETTSHTVILGNGTYSNVSVRDVTNVTMPDSVVIDYSGNGNNGIMQNGMEDLQPSSPVAWEMDEVSNYLEFKNLRLDNHDFIISFWWRGNKVDSDQSFFDNCGDNPDNRGVTCFNYRSGTIYYRFTNGGSYYANASCFIPNLRDNNWKFLTFVKSNDKIQIYEGLTRYRNSSADFSGAGVDLTTSSPFIIGSQTDGGYYLGKYLGLFAVYVFDGKDGAPSSLPASYETSIIKKLYENTKYLYEN